jgi:uncharacterized protein DUF6174
MSRWRRSALTCVALVWMGLSLNCRRSPQQVGQSRAEYYQARLDSIARARTALLRDLPKYERRWAVRGPTNYQFRLHLGCYCDAKPAADIAVQHGTIVEIRDTTGRMLPDSIRLHYAYTIPRLFEQIRSELGSDNFTVMARFDRKLGFPVYIGTDNVHIWDGGYTLEVTDFRPLSVEQ